jgi:hypothetical protein
LGDVPVEVAAEDDARPAASTWWRLSLLAAFPGLNPLWWVAAGPALAARARARRRPFGAEGGVRSARRLLLAGQALAAAAAVTLSTWLVLATGAPAALSAAGPAGAAVVVHSLLTAAGAATLVGVTAVLIPPDLRAGDRRAARTVVLLTALTWAAPLATPALLTPLA